MGKISALVIALSLFISACAYRPVMSEHPTNQQQPLINYLQSKGFFRKDADDREKINVLKEAIKSVSDPSSSYYDHYISSNTIDRKSLIATYTNNFPIERGPSRPTGSFFLIPPLKKDLFFEYLAVAIVNNDLDCLQIAEYEHLDRNLNRIKVLAATFELGRNFKGDKISDFGLTENYDSIGVVITETKGKSGLPEHTTFEGSHVKMIFALPTYKLLTVFPCRNEKLSQLLEEDYMGDDDLEYALSKVKKVNDKAKKISKK